MVVLADWLKVISALVCVHYAVCIFVCVSVLIVAHLDYMHAWGVLPKSIFTRCIIMTNYIYFSFVAVVVVV